MVNEGGKHEGGQHWYAMSNEDIHAIQHSYAMAEFILKLDKEKPSAEELKEFQEKAREIKPSLHRMGNVKKSEASSVNTPGAVVKSTFGLPANKRARFSALQVDSPASFSRAHGGFLQGDAVENSPVGIAHASTNTMGGSSGANRTNNTRGVSANWMDEPTAGVPMNIVKDYHMQLAVSNHKTCPATDIRWDMGLG